VQELIVQDGFHWTGVRHGTCETEGRDFGPRVPQLSIGGVKSLASLGPPGSRRLVAGGLFDPEQERGRGLGTAKGSVKINTESGGQAAMILYKTIRPPLHHDLWCGRDFRWVQVPKYAPPRGDMGRRGQQHIAHLLPRPLVEAPV